MTVGSIYGSASHGAVFAAPGLRAPKNSPPVEPVDPVARQRQFETLQRRDEQSQEERSNTAPSPTERQAALDSGRTRGAFVDILA